MSTIARGGSPRPIEDYLTDDANGINWIKIGDTEKDGKYILQTKEKIKPEGLSKTRYVRSGDFLLTNSMSFGRPYILKTDGCIHDGWLVIGNIDTVFDQDYLYYGLSSGFMYTTLSLLAAGSTVKNLKSDTVRSVLFPIPPLNEQKRMARRLESLIAFVDVINAEKAQLTDIITQAKSKILDLAIRGQLVPQDPADEPASVLLERIRAEKEELIKQGKIKRDKKESVIFKGEDNSYYEKIGAKTTCIDDELPFDLPDNWSWCRLGSVCSSIQYGLSNSAEQSGTHRLLRITDIQNGMVNWDAVPYTTVKDAENYLLCSNDIVFARTGATVGKSFLITDIPYDTVYASYLIRIRILNGVDPSYVYDFFNSLCYWNQITVKAVGIGQPNCNGTSLSNLLIPIPPARVQSKITVAVKHILAYVSTIEQNFN